jgi:hypothetical protein
MIEAGRRPQVFVAPERGPGGKVPKTATFGPALALARADEAIE